MNNKEYLKLSKEMAKVLIELDKCRTSTIQDGWQTQKYAKKARKWDYYAEYKRKLNERIENLPCLLNQICQCRGICKIKEVAKNGTYHL